VALNDVTLQDPKDRDSSNRLTIGKVEADVTLASVWSGRPQITELVITKPVLNVPLLRERSGQMIASPKPSPAAAGANAPVIERVRVNDGTVVFFNLRDRVDSRIEGINADATIGADRKIKVTGGARAGDKPLKFELKGRRAATTAGTAEYSGRARPRCARRSAGTAVGQGRGAAQRLSGHDQRSQRHHWRRRVQRLGIGRRL